MVVFQGRNPYASFKNRNKGVYLCSLFWNKACNYSVYFRIMCGEFWFSRFRMAGHLIFKISPVKKHTCKLRNTLGVCVHMQMCMHACLYILFFFSFSASSLGQPAWRMVPFSTPFFLSFSLTRQKINFCPFIYWHFPKSHYQSWIEMWNYLHCWLENEQICPQAEIG